MFSLFKKKVVESPESAFSAREKLLEEQCQRLTDQLNKLEESCRNSKCSFNFKAVNAFSIERNWNDGVESTIIGYTLDEQIIHNDGRIIDKSTVKEWYLYCSREQHEKLVQEFNEHKKGK